MKLPAALRGYVRDAREAFSHAPLEVLTGLLVAVTFSFAIRDRHPEWWVRIAGPGAVALVLFFAASVLRARGALSARARWGASAAVAAAAAAYGAFGLDPDHASDFWRLACLLGAAVFALTLTPLARGADSDAADPGASETAVPDRRAAERDPPAPGTPEPGTPGRDRFWRFNARLLARVISVGLYGAALWAALSGAVAAVTTLFELDTPGELFGDLAGGVFFALVPWVLVGGTPALVAAPADRRTPPVVSTLGRYLFLPVLVVYVAILTAYTVKVAATGELPKNLLSPIVLLAGLFGFAGAVLVEPLLRDRAHTAVERTVRVFPAVLLFLLPLALWAVWERRDQYGWTEFRLLRLLLLLALVVLALWGTARLVRGRAPLLAEIPAVLGATLLLGALVAGPLSRADQTGRLRAALAEAGMLRGGRYAGALEPPLRPIDTMVAAPPAAPPAKRTTIPKARFERIRGTAGYLHRAHGPGALRPVFGGAAARYPSGWDLAAAIPVEPGCDPAERPRYVTSVLPPDVAVPGLGGGTLYRVELAGRYTPRYAGGAAPSDSLAAPLRLALAGSALEVRARLPDAWSARVDLAPLVARMAGYASGCEPRGEPPLPAADALRPLVDARGRVRGQLLLTQVAIGPAEVVSGRDPGPARVLDAVFALVVVAP